MKSQSPPASFSSADFAQSASFRTERHPAKFSRVRSGFTLLETMLALTLALLLLSAVYAAIDQSWKLTSSGREEMERAQLARALIHRISIDIRAITYVAPPPVDDTDTSTTTTSSGSSSRAEVRAGAAGQGAVAEEEVVAAAEVDGGRRRWRWEVVAAAVVAAEVAAVVAAARVAAAVLRPIRPTQSHPFRIQRASGCEERRNN